MRLYIKLFAFIVAAASIQQFVFDDGPPSELWFGLRCSFAYMTADKPMIERLVVEAQDVQAAAHSLRVNSAGR